MAFNITKELLDTFTAGLDNITSFIVKNSAGVFAVFLNIVFNLALNVKISFSVGRSQNLFDP